MKKFDRVKAVVSLDAIAHNFEEMKKEDGCTPPSMRY